MANTPLRADSARANPIARRDMLAAALLGGASLAASSVAVAAEPEQINAPEWEDPATASRRIDVDFWRAYDRQKRIYSRWMQSYAALEGSLNGDKIIDRWCNLHHEAECKMLRAPTKTLPALHAKLHSATSSEFDFNASPSDDGFSLADIVLWDIERMMKAEYRA
ncbi:hypothetical protein F4U94_14655 [Sphingobium limneticum]|uniref:hypothetical protein n=1 Tax=Sphingobium limneticum TaxID=1007511 RepID=UPI00123DB5F5|nr:hypothetical protein [Sphingobium limneticum]KAA9014072.1 hypothetical protein F4U94_14655 [Sphingobium limneticum]